MKKRTVGWKKITAIVLAVVLLFTMTDLSSLAMSVETAESVTANEINRTGTFSKPIKFLGLSDGVVTLRDETAAEWIERLDLSDASVIRSFYNRLVEGTDNDGEEDFLIDDDLFVDDGQNHGISIGGVGGRVLSVDALNAKIDEILNNYGAFMQAAMDAFDRDHPEVFWLSGEYQFGVSGSYYEDYYGGIQYDVKVYYLVKGADFDARAEKYRSEAAIRTAIAERDACVEQILQGTEEKNAYERVLHFNEALTTRNEYNTSPDLNAIPHDSSECISALRGSVGEDGPVCEGYARAFKVLCDRSGISCVLADGTAVSGYVAGPHMWNLVMLDGEWYAADITWDDPVGDVGGAVSGYENSDWLLVGSTTEVEGKPFPSSHVTANRASCSGISFGTGPVLSEDAYVPSSELGDEVIGCKSFVPVRIELSEGRLRTDGSVTDERYWVTTDFLEVSEGQRYRYVGISLAKDVQTGTGSVCAFDAEGKFLTCLLEGGDYTEGAEIKIPAGTAYIRCCYFTGTTTVYGLQYQESDVHTWETELIPPTCEEDGYTLYTCSRCRETDQREFVPSLGHEFTQKVVDPTCYLGGYTKYTCERCGYSYKTDQVPTNGHTYGDWYVSKPVTDSEDGEERRDCEKCTYYETKVISHVKLVGIRLEKMPDKTCYLLGEEFSGDGMMVQSQFSDGSTKWVNKYTISGYDCNQLGKQTITVTYKEMSVTFTVTVITHGDVNMDGKITITDLLAIKAHLLNKNTLTGFAADVADLNDDGKITITDFLQIKSHLLGKSTITN